MYFALNYQPSQANKNIKWIYKVNSKLCMWLITYLVPKQTDRYLSAFDLVFITKVGKEDTITFFPLIYMQRKI